MNFLAKNIRSCYLHTWPQFVHTSVSLRRWLYHLVAEMKKSGFQTDSLPSCINIPQRCQRVSHLALISPHTFLLEIKIIMFFLSLSFCLLPLEFRMDAFVTWLSKSEWLRFLNFTVRSYHKHFKIWSERKAGRNVKSRNITQSSYSSLM